MDNKKDDEYYISEVIENIDAIISYSEGQQYDEFIKDAKSIDAIMFRLIQMAENVNNMSREFKAKHKEVPWNEIHGFRNRIVHEYGKTDYRIVYDIVSDDIVGLKDTLTNILEEMIVREAENKEN